MSRGPGRLEEIEQRLAVRPKIAIPTIALHGEANGVGPPETSADHARFFSGPYERRIIPRAGHNLPHEVPEVVRPRSSLSARQSSGAPRQAPKAIGIPPDITDLDTGLTAV
jgi:pimeloyl-ACP methyl ester carboxylesterase